MLAAMRLVFVRPSLRSLSSSRCVAKRGFLADVLAVAEFVVGHECIEPSEENVHVIRFGQQRGDVIVPRREAQSKIDAGYRPTRVGARRGNRRA